jgi:hypothetical protein
MFRYHERVLVQRGQKERDGRLKDSPRGKRWMHTFKNDPTIAPKKPATATQTALGNNVSTSKAHSRIQRRSTPH